MTDLQQLLDEYLATRRALGVRLKLSGSLLQRFVAFAAQSEAAFITTELALQWATEPRDVQPPSGRTASGWYVASPALRMPWILATRCHRQACSPTGTAARSPISTATGRSTTCCVRPKDFPGPPDSDLVRTPRSWRCWRSPGCGAPNRCA